MVLHHVHLADGYGIFTKDLALEAHSSLGELAKQVRGLMNRARGLTPL